VFRRRHRRCDTFHCHWVMDLYPDVMVAHGMIGGDGVAARVLRGLTRWGFGGRRCKAVLTLGPDMADRLGAYVAPSRLSWIPLWGQGNTTLVEARRESDSGEVSSGQDRYLQVVEDVDPVDPVENVVALRRARGWGAFGEELVLMYSGNMGLGHYIEDFFALVDDGQNPAATGTPSGSASMAAMRLVFAGGGKRRKEVDAFIGQHPGLPIERMDYAPEEQLLEHLQTADVHLVSLRQEWDGTMVPSKLQGIFGVGRPVLFVGSETCAIGQWIAESGGGWIVAPGSAGRMRDVLEEMRDPQERARRAEAALAYAKANFNVTINGPRVAKCFSTGCL
jgi:colanic acid biosynthesis glycosyl transferase WcaI